MTACPAVRLSYFESELAPIGSLVAETVEWLNRASRYDEAQALADSALTTELSQDDEAEIRLRMAAGIEDPEQRIAEIRRALQVGGINDISRPRHQAWLAYFEVVNGLHVDAWQRAWPRPRPGRRVIWKPGSSARPRLP